VRWSRPAVRLRSGRAGRMRPRASRVQLRCWLHAPSSSRRGHAQLCQCTSSTRVHTGAPSAVHSSARRARDASLRLRAGQGHCDAAAQELVLVRAATWLLLMLVCGLYASLGGCA